MSNNLKATLRKQGIKFNEKQNSVAIELNNMKQREENLKQGVLFEKKTKQQEIDKENQKAASDLLKLKEKYAFQKEQLKQADYLDNVRQSVIQNVYAKLKVGFGYQVNLSGKDPIINIVDRF